MVNIIENARLSLPDDMFEKFMKHVKWSMELNSENIEECYDMCSEEIHGETLFNFYGRLAMFDRRLPLNYQQFDCPLMFTPISDNFPDEAVNALLADDVEKFSIYCNTWVSGFVSTIAASLGKIKIFKAFIDYNVSRHTLGGAVFSKNREMIEFLLEKGYPVTLSDLTEALISYTSISSTAF